MNHFSNRYYFIVPMYTSYLQDLCLPEAPACAKGKGDPALHRFSPTPKIIYRTSSKSFLERQKVISTPTGSNLRFCASCHKEKDKYVGDLCSSCFRELEIIKNERRVGKMPVKDELVSRKANNPVYDIIEVFKLLLCCYEGLWCNY